MALSIKLVEEDHYLAHTPHEDILLATFSINAAWKATVMINGRQDHKKSATPYGKPSSRRTSVICCVVVQGDKEGNEKLTQISEHF
jgi:hypothetical protein